MIAPCFWRDFFLQQNKAAKRMKQQATPPIVIPAASPVERPSLWIVAGFETETAPGVPVFNELRLEGSEPAVSG